MSFESFAEGLGERPKEVPKEVTETMQVGSILVATDFLEHLKKSEELMKMEEVAKAVNDAKNMNLYKRGWRFQFGTSKQWAGLCSQVESDVYKSSKNKNIFVSINFVRGDSNWMKNMKSVIYHEIAHAIVRELFEGLTRQLILVNIDPAHKINQGHGVVWKFVCEAIREEGCVCEMFYANAALNDLFLPYRYCCVFCSNKQYGKTKYFAIRCSKCSKPITIETNPI